MKVVRLADLLEPNMLIADQVGGVASAKTIAAQHKRVFPRTRVLVRMLPSVRAVVRAKRRKERAEAMAVPLGPIDPEKARKLRNERKKAKQRARRA